MKLTSVLSVFLSLAIISQAVPVNFSKRRFGNENTPQAIAIFQEIRNITQGTDKEAEGADLSNEAIEALFVDAPACDQQDKADEIIDLGHSLGGEKEKQLIEVAKTFRQLERNTPNGQPSELCAKPPKNNEIIGLIQLQDTGLNASVLDQGISINEPDPDDPDQNATPNEPDPDDPDQNNQNIAPNEPDPDDPDQPNEPDPDDPDQNNQNNQNIAPNEPDPDDPDQPTEPDPDDPDQNNQNITPNEPDPDDPDQKGSNSGGSDGVGDGTDLPKDPDEDSEKNNDGSSPKENIPQEFA